MRRAPGAEGDGTRTRERDRSPSPRPLSHTPRAGNFITDRPTTKVHGPPGGRSSIVFG
jgi:hypothetical protein